MTDLGRAADLHRQVAALTVAAGHAGVEHQDLPGVRARIARQQPRFIEAAAAMGTAPPALSPTPAEIASGAAGLGDLTPEAVGAALRTASSTLDAVDAALTAHPHPPVPENAPTPAARGMPVGMRNGLVYAGYSIGVVGLQVALFIAASETTLPLLAPLCLLVLPAFAWLAAWTTIGIAFREPGAGRVRRIFSCA
jgi:hypothetical protein